MAGQLRVTVAAMVLAAAGAMAASAEDIETRGGHCNDTYFGSDGSGVTGCIEYALRWDDDVIGIGIFGVQPEQLGENRAADPLDDLS